MQKQSWMKLKDLTPAASNSINATVILVEKGSTIEEGKEKTKTCVALVADETACVNFQMWGAECEAFHPGDIIRISKGIFCHTPKRQGHDRTHFKQTAFVFLET
ncbi:SOSS complex subunit B [Rhynchospora pubera]|uniref:SOSS complex subunit B n=1 Tax=Rhynchospora pubera TaxID=906938 RepID=A0AAV8F232_9POAL|nr:SOSS complex subunit B [Rhynchospora pubera]